MLTGICAGICFAGLVILFIKPEFISIMLNKFDKFREKLSRR